MESLSFLFIGTLGIPFNLESQMIPHVMYGSAGCK